MKTYLKIETFTKEGYVKIINLILLSNNVTGLSCDDNYNESRIYLQSANPFPFVRVFLPYIELMELLRGQKKEDVCVLREGSKFVYSVIQL